MIVGAADCNMARAFLLYRGSLMKEEWIHHYRDNKGQVVRLRGNTSCSRSLKVALTFALDDPKPDFTPVLFVTACQNFYAPKGIMMNNDLYSKYPDEYELLLQEGCKVWVLEFDEDILIQNEYNMKKYHDKNITIIHLFHHN